MSKDSDCSFVYYIETLETTWLATNGGCLK